MELKTMFEQDGMYEFYGDKHASKYEIGDMYDDVKDDLAELLKSDEDFYVALDSRDYAVTAYVDRTKGKGIRVGVNRYTMTTIEDYLGNKQYFLGDTERTGIDLTDEELEQAIDTFKKILEKDPVLGENEDGEIEGTLETYMEEPVSIDELTRQIATFEDILNEEIGKYKDLMTDIAEDIVNNRKEEDNE